MSAPLLAEAVEFAYGGRPVLRGVTLSLARGEIVALLGPNGAGKSTLVRALCGRLKPHKGRIAVEGEDPVRSRKARAAMGLVPQEIALYPHLTVKENLKAFGRLQGLSGALLNERIEAALRLSLAADRADQRVETLSGGYQRRINIAAAVLHEPRLLILDEPAVGVDLEARAAINDFLRSLTARGTAVLLTTHDLDQAAAVSDRVAVLVEGRILLDGAPSALIAERFGGDRELIVDLKEAPDIGGRHALEAMGLTAPGTATLWRGRFARSGTGLREIEAALARRGLKAREIRLREPGLDSLLALAGAPDLAESTPEAA